MLIEKEVMRSDIAGFSMVLNFKILKLNIKNIFKMQMRNYLHLKYLKRI